MTPKQLKDTPLPELKRIAFEELNLTKDQVREYGHLSYRATWENAISLTARSANADIRDGIKQLTITDALDSAIEAPNSQESENVRKKHIIGFSGKPRTSGRGGIGGEAKGSIPAGFTNNMVNCDLWPKKLSVTDSTQRLNKRTCWGERWGVFV